MVFQDLRRAVRSLASRPGFTMAALVSLALGIGAETSVYALMRTLFDRPPAGVVDPHEIVAVSSLDKGKPVEDAIRFPDYLYLRERSTVFSALASHFNSGVNLVDTERGEALNGHVVSANYFAVLGLAPHLGRFFNSQEDRVADAVVVLSHSYWQRRFDGDVRSIGGTITLNHLPFTVIGVAPAGFEGAKISWPGDVFLPNLMARVASSDVDVRSRNSARLDLLGRLRPGRQLPDARTEMSRLARQLEGAFPETNQGIGLFASGLNGIHPRARGAAQLPRLLFLVVSCLIVVACVNLSGLLLARIATRRREIAISLAIGARRLDIIRQILTESFLLSLTGGGLGLLVALAGNRMLERYYGVEIEGVQHLYRLTLDWPTFGVSMALVASTALCVGLVPALQASRQTLIPTIKDDGAARGFRRSRVRMLFLVVQVATSVVLLVGAGLLIRSVDTLRRNPGFDAEKVLYLRMKPRASGYSQAAAGAYFENVTRRVASLPAVESLAFARLPPTLRIGTVPVSMAGAAAGGAEIAVRAALNIVTPGYFQTLRIPIIRGRAFEDRDRRLGLTQIVLNQALADRLWPNQDPVGQTAIVSGQRHEVVGIAAYRDLNEGDAPAPALFLGDSVAAVSSGRLFVRVKGDTSQVLSLLRAEIHALDPSVAVTEALPLAEVVENLHAEAPLAMRVAGFAGGLALLLCAVGLYSALTTAVTQRTRELAIRMALGAQRSSVLTLVLREGMTPALLGLVLGFIAALNANRLLSNLLFGVAPGDPLTFLVSATLLTAAALAACSVPAWRAVCVEPSRALRQSL